MFLLGLFAVLASSFFGWIILGVTAVMLIWMVATIHMEFSGGSGTKKLWPTIWFLVVPLGFFLAAQLWPNPAQAQATTFVGSFWASLTFGHVCLMLAEYVGIGLAYSLFEMRVTLWRDKKKVVTQFETYLKTDIISYIKILVIAKLGSSTAGPEATTSTSISAGGIVGAVETKVLGWGHVLVSDIFTWADAFKAALVGRTFVTGAEAAFKADVAKFEAGVKTFLAAEKHEKFNPSTAYTDFQINPDGTLTASINKGDLAICLLNWTFWWPFYLLNFVFGDMFEAVFTRLSAWVVKVYGGYVKKYFADITAVKL